MLVLFNTHYFFQFSFLVFYSGFGREKNKIKILNKKSRMLSSGPQTIPFDLERSVPENSPGVSCFADLHSRTFSFRQIGVVKSPLTVSAFYPYEKLREIV